MKEKGNAGDHMKKRVRIILCCFLLTVSAILGCAVPGPGQRIRQKETAKSVMKEITDSAIFFLPVTEVPTASGWESGLPAVAPEDLQNLSLCPGGMPFGVRFFTEGLTVVGFAEVETENGRVCPAERAGIRQRDVILRVNGEVLGDAAQFTEAVEHSGGKELCLLCRRGKNEIEIRVTPVYCRAEQRYKTGIWVRDSGAGIGTVTFIIPDTGAFAGLGHGICDSDTGELIPMRRGTVSDVTISSVVRGAAGAPGELKGYFNAGKVGVLLGNSSSGVWGMFSEVPENVGDPLPVGLRDEVREGEAEILCTLDSNQTRRYSIRISNIHRDAAGSKCFTVTVTDPALLQCAGGIVQGMSGSPIIQGGKLIGAVTHVLINDPTAGYGIFLENMLVNMPIMVR